MMLRFVRLLGRILGVALQRELAFRADLAFQVILTLVTVGAGFFALGVVFRVNPHIAGWDFGTAAILLGIYQMQSGVLGTFVEPNLAWFAGKLNDGDFDDVLLKPLPSLVLTSLGTCQPLALLGAIFGAGLAGYGVVLRQRVIAPDHIGAALLLALVGVILAWAMRVTLASVAFWSPGFEPSIFYSAFWQLGRYPITVYPRALAALLTYVVPLAFVATLPTQALTGGVALPTLAAGVGAAALAVASTGIIWRAGLRRYTSATS